MTTIRIVHQDDIDELTGLLVRSREFLAPFEPRREDSYFTAAYQRKLISAKLAAHESGSEVPFIIIEDDKIVGQLTLDRIEFGPYKSADIGYWVAQSHGGRGIATRAVSKVLSYAWEELGLRRIQAATLPDNEPSMRVLVNNGFVECGNVKSYMEIAGERRDHILFERISPVAGA